MLIILVPLHHFFVNKGANGRGGEGTDIERWYGDVRPSRPPFQKLSTPPRANGLSFSSELGVPNLQKASINKIATAYFGDKNSTTPTTNTPYP